MKILGTRRLAATIGAVCLTIAAPTFGQSDGSMFDVHFSNADNSIAVGNGYADPYSGTVTYNGSIVNGNGLLVCDDYLHEVVNGENWTATGMQASTLTNVNIGATRFGSGIGVTGYEQVAVLVSQMLATTSKQQQADLSAAIWWITSGGTHTGATYRFSGVTLNPNATALLTAVLGMNSSTLAAALSNSSNLWILTPTAGQGGVYGSPQEMWILVPEGGATLAFLLLAALSCFGAIRLKLRDKRI